MINKFFRITCALAMTHPLLAGAQGPPAEEGAQGKTTRKVNRLRLQAAKPALTGVEPVRRAYWDAPATVSDKEGSDAKETQTQPAPPAEPGISDNSFLMEEAYNQEYGVVQHISGFGRAINGDGWGYSFTQEWPFNAAPKSQLSYTATAVSGGVPGAGGGIGDVLLHYRYQVLGGGEAAVAFAPRASLLIPSGSSRHGRGAGGAGMQFNLPVSWRAAEKLVTHWNAGTTIVPHAKNAAGDKATTYGYFLGQSFVYEATARFNLMLETVFDSAQGVVAADSTAWENSVIINPGFRWAHNFESGLQIVPGIAFPVEVGRAGRGNWGIFLYLSFEHPFGKRAP